MRRHGWTKEICRTDGHVSSPHLAHKPSSARSLIHRPRRTHVTRVAYDSSCRTIRAIFSHRACQRLRRSNPAVRPRRALQRHRRRVTRTPFPPGHGMGSSDPISHSIPTPHSDGALDQLLQKYPSGHRANVPLTQFPASGVASEVEQL